MIMIHEYDAIIDKLEFVSYDCIKYIKTNI